MIGRLVLRVGKSVASLEEMADEIWRLRASSCSRARRMASCCCSASAWGSMGGSVWTPFPPRGLPWRDPETVTQSLRLGRPAAAEEEEEEEGRTRSWANWRDCASWAMRSCSQRASQVLEKA